MTKPVDIRAHIVNVFRRDLIGPGPQDSDLAGERLNESPSRWYLAGFLAPAEDPLSLDGDDDDSNPSAQEEMELDVEEPDADGTGGAATDNEEPDPKGGLQHQALLFCSRPARGGARVVTIRRAR